MKMEREKIVWKDGLLKMKLLFIFVVLFSISLIFLMFLSEEILAKIICIVLAISLLYLICRAIKFRRNYIMAEGIFIYDGHTHKGVFIRWDEILGMSIVKKYVSTGKYTSSHKELEIKTRNQRYACIVFDTQGLIQALKKLNKSRLLDKKSEEKYGK
jgi:hypothetical protein